MAESARRVLVVEDDAGIRELLRLHLDLAGFSIDEVADGREAAATRAISSRPAPARVYRDARRQDARLRVRAHASDCEPARRSRTRRWP
jgi:CheY-like chemotaxis protein